MKPLSGPTADWLFLPGVKAYCPPGGDLGTAGGLEHPLNQADAQAACKANEQCDFFSWHGEDRSVQFCHGRQAKFEQSWYDPRWNRVGDLVVMHPRTFQADGYMTLPNYQAICEPDQILREIPAVYSVGDVARKCDANRECTYWALSTNTGLHGIAPKFKNTAWLCKGKPSFAYHLGWLSGTDPGFMPPRLPGSDGKIQAFEGVPMPSSSGPIRLSRQAASSFLSFVGPMGMNPERAKANRQVPTYYGPDETFQFSEPVPPPKTRHESYRTRRHREAQEAAFRIEDELTGIDARTIDLKKA